MNNNISRRIVFLDIARACAILLVVLCHSIEEIYIMEEVHNYTSLSIQSKLFMIVSFTISRLGVPIFLFISGYLLINRDYENDDNVKKFYKKNLLPLIITTEIWIIIYNIFICIYYNEPILVEKFIRQCLFIEIVQMDNFWYMPVIIGIYLAIPYLSRVLKNFSFKSLKIPVFIVFIIFFCVPTINLIFNVYKIKQIGNIMDIRFLGSEYGLYLILGFFVSQGSLKKVKLRYLLCSGFIFFCISVYIQFFEYNHNIVYNIWYNSPFLLLCSLCIFELFTRIDLKTIPNWSIKVCEYISRIALAIFFIHIIITSILGEYINMISILNPIKVILLFFITFVVSVFSIFILSKIRIIKEKVFLIKN